MKLITSIFVFILILQLVVCAKFSAVDQEIFQVNHELKMDLGEDMDFYGWLKLPKKSKSSYDDITRAYKKLSVQLHPDKFYQKNKNKYTPKKFKKIEKLNNERFQRLSVIGEILRSDRKLRYDFYLSNGFPKWTGKGFFYSKFKPGFILTLVLVFIIVSLLHYVLLILQRKQERKRIELLKQDIKNSAWPNGYPPSDFSDRKVNSPSLDKVFIVKGDGSIFLVEQDGNETILHLVDSDDIVDVTYRDCFPYRLFKSCWNNTFGKMVPTVQITNLPPLKIKKESSDVETDEVAPQKKKNKNKGGLKMELPNGKVVYGRKRK